jgi:polyphosphate kinase
VKQWVPLTAGLEPGQRLLIPLHELVRGNMGKLYTGMAISGITLVRITRDAEVDLERRPIGGNPRAGPGTGPAAAL